MTGSSQITLIKLMEAEKMDAPVLISNEPVFPHIDKYGVVYPYPDNVNRFPEDVLRKIVFSITKPPARVDLINPGLANIARMLNVYGHEQISYKRYDIAAVIYGDAISAILENDYHKEIFFIDNPNIELIDSLKKARVRIFGCWQSMNDNNYGEHMIIKDMEFTNCAMNALTYYQQNHYMLMPM